MSKQSRQPRSTFGRIALEPAAAVVRADVDLAVGDDRIAVRLRAELGRPT